MELSCQNFGLNILEYIKSKTNVVYSPFSIFAALSMTYPGSQGETLASILKVIHCDDSDLEKYHQRISDLMFGKSKNSLNQSEKQSHFTVANKLFLDEKFSLLDSFTTVINNFYGGDVTNVDFQKKYENARNIINKWVEEKTNSKIKDLLSSGSIDSLTRVVLVNAIYFKGIWIDKFQNLNSKPFHNLNGETKMVPTMNRTSKCKYNTFEQMGFSVTVLDFESNKFQQNFSMYVMLPDKGFDLTHIEKKIQEVGFEQILKKQQFDNKLVYIEIPKFRIEFSISLKECLTNLGMGIAFSDAADFSNMATQEELKISDVIHKAFIEIDEIGAEAAAATAVPMMTRCALPERPAKFICDHPFLFVLTIEDNVPLFVGRYQS